MEKKKIKYSKGFDAILRTVRKFLKNLQEISSTFFVHS